MFFFLYIFCASGKLPDPGELSYRLAFVSLFWRETTWVTNALWKREKGDSGLVSQCVCSVLRFFSSSLGTVPESWCSKYPIPNLHLFFKTQPSGRALAPRFVAQFFGGKQRGKRTHSDCSWKGRIKRFRFWWSVILRFTFHPLSVQLLRIGVPYPTSNWTSRLVRFSRSCPLVRRLQWMDMLTRQEAVDFVLGNSRTSTELRPAKRPGYT